MTRARRRPGLRLAIAAIAAAVVVVPAAGLRAQDAGDDESEAARVQRDQARMTGRLPTLREKMERLAERYDDEGRTRNATLLREALVKFDELDLPSLAAEVERSLEQKKLSTIELQDRLVDGFEGLYAVLRDRRDVDELESQSDMARQGAAELGFLAENQRRLLAETRALTDRPDQLVDEALEIAEQLARELDSAGGSLEELRAALSVLGEAQLAQLLARQQRALASENLPRAATQALIQGQLDMLRERLGGGDAGQAPEDGGPAPEGRGELSDAIARAREAARAAADRAAEDMARARAALEAAEGRRGGRADAGESDEARSGESREGAGASSEGRSGTGETSAGQASDGQTGGSEPSAGPHSDGQTGDAQPSDAQPSESQPSESQPGEGQADERPPSAGPPGGETPADTESPDASAGGPPDEPAEIARAREQMARAAERLDDVAQRLQEAERAATAQRNRQQAMSLATSRDAAAQAEELEERAERLEALQPESGPELLDRTRELLAELSKIAPDVERGDVDAARQRQQQAAAGLADLMEMLRARSAGASAERPEPSQEQLDALAERQAELQEQLRRLMERLSELPDQQFQPSMERASDAMEQADASLREGDGDEAQTREEEAAEQLEQAQRELKDDRDRYEQLRQEEVLFQIAEELAQMRESQVAINVETAGVEASRGEEERLGRSQRRALVRLAGQQDDLAERTVAIRGALDEDGAVTFVYALDQIRLDMSRVGDLLRDEQTGMLVRSLQGDVVTRIDDLQAVLAKEDERRREALKEQQEQGESPGDSMAGEAGPSPLVPKVAELYLIQRMEQSALARLENFERLNPGLFEEGRGPTPVDRELLERWAFEHERVTTMFRDLVPEQQAQDGLTAPRGPGHGGAEGGAEGGAAGGDGTGEGSTEDGEAPR